MIESQGSPSWILKYGLYIIPTHSCLKVWPPPPYSLSSHTFPKVTQYFYGQWILASLVLVLQVFCISWNVCHLGMLRVTYEVKYMIGFKWKSNASMR
jgi:hypothetical protein